MTSSALRDRSADDSAQPLVASIVITTFRRPAMLSEVLDALRPQLLGQPVEVIIVDNCPEASAQDVVAQSSHPAIRYELEKRSGVVHARNRGVSVASGAYVIFLDDDEIPVPGWLSAWLAQADGQTDASFGQIAPRFLGPCPPDLKAQVVRSFSRELNRPHGGDISDLSAYLGTGNAMFHKERCLSGGEPFDLRFNARGGEDVWLIRGLVRAGRRLLWNHASLVEELVPVDRMTLPSLRLRRYNQGQLRSIVAFGDGGVSGLARAMMWMMAGLAQVVIFGGAAVGASVVSPRRHADLLCAVSGGLGKVFWWHKPRMQAYGTAA